MRRRGIKGAVCGVMLGDVLQIYYDVIFGEYQGTEAYRQFEREHGGTGGPLVATLQDFHNNFEHVLELFGSQRAAMAAEMAALRARAGAGGGLDAAAGMAEVERRLRALNSAVNEEGVHVVEGALVFVTRAYPRQRRAAMVLSFLAVYTPNALRPAESRVNSGARVRGQRPRRGGDGEENVDPAEAGVDEDMRAMQEELGRLRLAGGEDARPAAAAEQTEREDRRRVEDAVRRVRENRGNMRVSGGDMVQMRGLLLRLQSLQTE